MSAVEQHRRQLSLAGRTNSKHEADEYLLFPGRLEWMARHSGLSGRGSRRKRMFEQSFHTFSQNPPALTSAVQAPHT